jgi:hypothetical protein
LCLISERSGNKCSWISLRLLTSTELEELRAGISLRLLTSTELEELRARISLRLLTSTELEKLKDVKESLGLVCVSESVIT